jgi:hypothetical protein
MQRGPYFDMGKTYAAMAKSSVSQIMRQRDQEDDVNGFKTTKCRSGQVRRRPMEVQIITMELKVLGLIMQLLDHG